jgi:hypothetical protein
MEAHVIISKLRENKAVFESLLAGTIETEYLWKPGPDKWCLLEVLCHLYDEEREDFRARIIYILNGESYAMPSIDPVGWVDQRQYLQQDFGSKLSDLLSERDHSIELLSTLKAPNWTNAYQHPKLGRMTAGMLLSNWLAHDYLHFRQIARLKYGFLEVQSGEDLSYAGAW